MKAQTAHKRKLSLVGHGPNGGKKFRPNIFLQCPKCLKKTQSPKKINWAIGQKLLIRRKHPEKYPGRFLSRAEASFTLLTSYVEVVPLRRNIYLL